ncbi:MAG TPA: acetyl-CoA carboxylase, carboxyltransferase subunit beta [Gemmatimonadales bacterium]|nr:acetyl-CoA carboxylase, carboxyltransferase subunit beta [Gemmatimonadales bacterium]
MAWFRKERKERKSSRERLEIPPDAWDKCEECGHVDIREKFERTLQVCPSCGFHRRISARRYVEILTDPGSFVELFGELRSVDALRFEGYADRVARAYRQVGSHDAILTGHGTLTGVAINIGAMEFGFMGGSMGSVVGEKVARLAHRSLERHQALVVVSASGGARMQEGVLSLMQMAKTSAVIAQLREAGVPFISILTNPTTGGVSASYALQGDVILAEPGAVVGFAGARVIKQTIGQDLPEGFQTSEFLLDHGMVDAVVPRARLAETTASLVRMMQGLPASGPSD